MDLLRTINNIIQEKENYRSRIQQREVIVRRVSDHVRICTVIAGFLNFGKIPLLEPETLALFNAVHRYYELTLYTSEQWAQEHNAQIERVSYRKKHAKLEPYQNLAGHAVR